MTKKFARSILLFLVVAGIFTFPAYSVRAQDPLITNPTESQGYADALEKCNISHWVPCILNVTDSLFVTLSAWFARTMAELFDAFLSFSLDSGSYAGVNNAFIERGWSIIRDIANVAFIFTLLYIAIKHILQAAHAGTKKLLTMLIISALLINFSLFFTRVVIDAGNILARTFYNSISVVNDEDSNHKSISVALISHVNPQELFTTGFFKPVRTRDDDEGQPSYAWVFFAQVLIIALNVIIGLTFLSVFLLFLARLVGLWFMMIFSPLAFVSLAIPGAGNMLGEFGWSKWLKQTLSLSFMAPIFLFFLFLLAMFLQIAWPGSVGGESSVDKILRVFVPFVVVVTILKLAKDRAKDMSGKFGEVLIGAAGKAFGYGLGAAGLAVGGAGLLGRYTIGQGARKLAQSDRLDQWTKSDNKYLKGFASATRAASVKASVSSFDARNTWVGKKTFGLVSSGASQAAGGGKISTKLFGVDGQKGAGKGGWRQMQKDTKKSALEKAEKRDLSVDESRIYQEALRKQADRAKELEKEGKTEKEIKDDDEYKKYEQQIKAEKKRFEDINKQTRKSQAAWQENFVWQPGRFEAAAAVRAGKKPEGEMEKLLKDLRKKEKEEKEKHGDDHGEEKHEKPSGSGFNPGAEAPHAPAPGGGGEPHHSTPNETRSVVNAIQDVGAKITKEGSLERKRDITESKTIGGLGAQISSIGRGANIQSEGGGIKEERNLAGFGERGAQTPNENSGPIGFQQPKQNDQNEEY